VRLFTRSGYNFADRFPMIVAAVESLPVRSCFLNGEAIVVDHNVLSVFDLLRYRQHDGAAVLCAFAGGAVIGSLVTRRFPPPWSSKTTTTHASS
jgi:hypothetical protein